MAFTLLNALINLLNSGNIGIDHQRIVGVIYDKSRFSAGRFFDMFFLSVVNLYFFISAGLRVVGSKFSGFLKSPVWQLLAIGFHDDMRSRTAFCVEPPVVSGSKNLARPAQPLPTRQWLPYQGSWRAVGETERLYEGTPALGRGRTE